MIDIIFAVGNIILCIGTLILIHAVFKNKNNLNGYTLLGALLTVIPISLFMVGYFLMSNWVALFFGSITFIYWFVVVVYKIKDVRK